MVTICFSCCALEFKPSKSQKKVLKRFNKFLANSNNQTGEDNRKMSTCSSASEVLGEGYEEGVEQFVETTKEPQYIDVKDVSILCQDVERLTEVESSSQGNCIYFLLVDILFVCLC